MHPSKPVAATDPSPLNITDPNLRNQARRTLPSSALLEGRREVLINHGGEIYLLRNTRNGKLILTK